MTSKPLSRRSKALTLVPLALLSGVWTASLVSSATASSTNDAKSGALPDGTKVPTAAIEAPASVPTPGVIAPAVPEGSADSVVSGASTNGIPAPALAAYQRGAQIINAADKSCNIPWELIGAIGRVESDHGRYGGNTLSANGISKPGIYGIELNGKNGTAAIRDTDGGQLDKDPVFDRAVGPMQFIPSTWQVVKVDADGDGQRNPQDINDASLATAVYLCSGQDNLSNRAGQQAAVLRYNHSQDYVNLVLRIMEAYSSGDYTAVPSGTYGGNSYSPSTSYSTAINHSYKAAKQKKARQKAAAQQDAANGGSTSSGSQSGSGLPGSTGSGTESGGGGNAASNLGDALGKAGKDITGGGSGSGGGSTPTDPVKKLTQPLASVACLAQVGVSTVANLLGAGKLTEYTACMKTYGY
jgi:membrane-bound lytic murein transglycosylase B